MLNEVVSEVERALAKGRIALSIDVLRRWLASAEPGDPEKLILAASPAMRDRVVTLLRDLLSRYPSTLLGCPVMLYAEPDVRLDSPRPPGLFLPFPRPEHAKPCSDLHFLGWLRTESRLPVALPFRPAAEDGLVPWRVCTAVIALFRTHPGVLEAESLELPAMWWAELFARTCGSVRIEGRLLLSYPDALDVAREMEAGALGQPSPGGLFTTELGWARDLGAIFHETCRLHSLD